MHGTNHRGFKYHLAVISTFNIHYNPHFGTYRIKFCVLLPYLAAFSQSRNFWVTKPAAIFIKKLKAFQSHITINREFTKLRRQRQGECH